MSKERIIGQAFAVSGNANNGVNDGAFYVNSNNGSGDANNNYGSQLSYQNMLPFRAQIIYNGKYYTFKGSDNEDSTGL